MMEQMVKIVIIDDHPMVLEGLKGLLQHHQDFTIVGSFNSPVPFLEFIQNNHFDVILMDINLPEIQGPELCQKVLAQYPQAKILAITNHQEAEFIEQMMNAGAKGYLLKNVSAEELNLSIQSVHNGKMYLSSDIQQILFNDNKTDRANHIQLTRREKEVLKFIAEGLTTQQMADTLFISPLTVESHRRNLMQKFQVNNSPALIRIAFEKKLIG